MLAIPTRNPSLAPALAELERDRLMERADGLSLLARDPSSDRMFAAALRGLGVCAVELAKLGFSDDVKLVRAWMRDLLARDSDEPCECARWDEALCRDCQVPRTIEHSAPLARDLDF